MICALLKRVEYFHSVGCRVSDQAFDCPPYAPASKDEVNAVFNKAMNGEKLTDYECNVYKTPIVIALGEKYHELGWTMALDRLKWNLNQGRYPALVVCKHIAQQNAISAVYLYISMEWMHET